MRTKVLIAVALVVAGGGFAAAHDSQGSKPAPCNIQGVWRTDKVVTNGKIDSTSSVEMKFVTKNHFAWVSQENRRDTLPLKTFRDSVRAYSDGGGAGTYRLSGNNYVERIDIFPDPTYIGKEWPATCQTTGNQWIHSWISPEYKDSTGRSRRDTVAEYFKRVE